jgi:hypothetical protein
LLLMSAIASAEPYDALLEAEWRKAHLQPAPPADDATYLRRAYLDLAGELPPVEVVRAFLDDKSAGKRARLVEGLLGSPRYAQHFAEYWEQLLLGRNARPNLVDERQLREWLRGRLSENARWDATARVLIAAKGRNSDGGPRNKPLEPSPSPSPAEPLNAAVNYVLRWAQQPEDLTGNYSRVFLGVQIQCAQCHDHPSEKWKQEDFRNLTAAFARIRSRPLESAKGIRRVVVEDLTKGKPAKALDGATLADRQELADWTARSPWLARALVNRYWAYFLGRGFVDPVDDFRRSNPPWAPALLDRLSADFVAHGYDLKWLIRTICASRAYQLSAAGRDGRLWADYRLRPLAPEQLLAALAAVTGLSEPPPKMRKELAFIFAVDEEGSADAFSGTLPQALFALNGEYLNRGAAGPALTSLLSLPISDEQKLIALYLRALSRPPAAAEARRWLPLVQKGRREWEDLLWALLNTSEFHFQH